MMSMNRISNRNMVNIVYCTFQKCLTSRKSDKFIIVLFFTFIILDQFKRYPYFRRQKDMLITKNTKTKTKKKNNQKPI